MKKIALITGASSGIGRELALLHASTGGDLIVIARRKDKLKALQEEVQQKYKQETYIIEKDLTQPGAAEAIYKEVKDQGFRIEYLINNAGFGGIGKFHEREWSKDLAMIQLNILALTALTRLFLPDFIEANQGKVLNVSSTASLLPGPMQAVYYASKAYVTSFSNALSEEIKESQVTVTALLPGATETEFGKRSGMDKTVLFKQTYSARKVARAGYEGMVRGKLNVMTGVSLGQKILFALIPFIPKRMLLRMVYQMQQSK